MIITIIIANDYESTIDSFQYHHSQHYNYYYNF